MSRWRWPEDSISCTDGEGADSELRRISTELIWFVRIEKTTVGEDEVEEGGLAVDSESAEEECEEKDEETKEEEDEILDARAKRTRRSVLESNNASPLLIAFMQRKYSGE